MSSDYNLGSEAKKGWATLLVGLALSLGGCGWKSQVADPAPDPPQSSAEQLVALQRLPPETTASPILPELPGVVTVSRQYPLLARTKGRIKRLFFVPGQYVRQGDILVKGYDHNFVVAPTHALVAERLIEGSTYMAPTTVVATMLETQPFQVCIMPPSSFTQVVAPGWEARLSRWDSKTFAAAGVILGAYLNTDGTLVVDLRLRSLAGGALPVGTKIRAILAPPQM